MEKDRKKLMKKVVEAVEDAEYEIGIALERLEEAANVIADGEDAYRRIDDMVNHAYDAVESVRRVVETVREECERAWAKTERKEGDE